MLTKIEQDTMEAVQRLAAKAPALQELTLRDLFAMAALQGLLAGRFSDTAEKTACAAYVTADEMLKERLR